MVHKDVTFVSARKNPSDGLGSKQSPPMVGRALPVDPDFWSGLGGEL